VEVAAVDNITALITAALSLALALYRSFRLAYSDHTSLDTKGSNEH
jgi:hypothetical protein